MIAARLPMLFENGSRLDWSQARYEVEIQIRGDKAAILHKLSEARELDNLLDDNMAAWVTELRCPRTLLSRQVCSDSPKQEITLGGEDVIGDTFLLTGLVATQALEISASGLNPFAWRRDSSISIPPGWWLVRGDPRATTPLTASLVQIQRDPDGRLAPGQMSVSEESDGGKPFFRITLAHELYDERRFDRDVQIAGLIAACGKFPRSSLSEGMENETHPVAEELRSRLEDADVPNWDDFEFDPARAATVLEAFFVKSPEASE
jgi:hypothetical protein